MLVFDVNCKESWKDIDRFWMKEVEKFSDTGVEIMILGNKSDLMKYGN